MTLKIPGSEIQRAFQKKAEAKGWVKNDSILKTASNKNYEYKPGFDISVDIAILSKELRSKGYEKYANELDAKVLEFKIAQKDLFKSDGEDALDLLEFAHQDGDVFIEDAVDGLGYVETLIGQHKKIVDVATREPKTKTAQLKESLPEYLGKFKFNLTLPQVFDLFKKNSGPLYDFVNVYYHDFFGKAYRYVVDSVNIYGSHHIPMATNIVNFLKKDPVGYLSKIQKQTSIKAVDLIQLPTNSTFESIKNYLSGKEEKIAQEIHRRFTEKYKDINDELNNVNSNINSVFSNIVSKLKFVQGDPVALKNYLNDMTSNGSYKFVFDVINAFFGNNYADVFASVFEQVLGEVKDFKTSLNFKDRINATIGRLISGGHMLIGAFADNPGLREKHESTIQAMHDMIQVLEANVNSTEEQLLSNLPSGITYNSYQELDNDTIELLEVIKKEIATAGNS